MYSIIISLHIVCVFIFYFSPQSSYTYAKIVHSFFQNLRFPFQFGSFVIIVGIAIKEIGKGCRKPVLRV